MTYWKGYKSRYYWSSYNRSKREELSDLFGGIDKDIEKAFYSLSSLELDALLIEYGRKYDKSAENYARKTYPKWKSGVIKPNWKTAERLIALLPLRLSKEKRFDLIKKLRQYYVEQKSKWEHIRASPENWQEKLIPTIDRFISEIRDLELPKEILKKATWLANGDSLAVQNILSSIDEEEARQRTAYLEAEFKRIEIFVQNIKDTKSASHVIKLPQGSITVTIEKEKPKIYQRLFGLQRTKMGNREDDLIPRDELQKALAIQQKRGNLLNLAFNDLSETQKLDLKKKIIEERINLDVSQARADQRFYDSSRDMSNTIQAVRNLEKSSKSDYEVKSSYETASGNTSITVKKNSNTVIIVVAVVIGIILFLFLSK